MSKPRPFSLAPPSVMNRTSILIRSNCLQFSHPHALVEFKFFCSYFCVKCTRWSTAESCSCRVRLPCRSLMSFSFDSNVHFSVFRSFFSKSCFTFLSCAEMTNWRSKHIVVEWYDCHLVYFSNTVTVENGLSVPVICTFVVAPPFSCLSAYTA